MTNGFSNLNRFVTTLTSTINFLTSGLEDLIKILQLCLYLFDNVTMTKLKE